MWHYSIINCKPSRTQTCAEKLVFITELPTNYQSTLTCMQFYSFHTLIDCERLRNNGISLVRKLGSVMFLKQDVCHNIPRSSRLANGQHQNQYIIWMAHASLCWIVNCPLLLFYAGLLKNESRVCICVLWYDGQSRHPH